jgi:hypothetical protein
MTEKFTPGEWRIEEHELAVGNCEMFGFRIRADKIICAAQSNELKDKPEMQSNAALIAAAPEMYHLLEYLADGVRFGGLQHTDRSLAAEIENLLKKAKGEQ